MAGALVIKHCNSIAYSIFVLSRHSTKAPIQGFQIAGQLWLHEFELYHYKARAYHPKLGRFMQTDPIGYGDGIRLVPKKRSFATHPLLFLVRFDQGLIGSAASAELGSADLRCRSRWGYGISIPASLNALNVATRNSLRTIIRSLI